MINIQKLCLNRSLFCGLLIKFIILTIMISAGAAVYGVKTGLWQNSFKFGSLLISAAFLSVLSEYIHVESR